ncbi:hypothetical protein [uncultured Desulfobulbus sp.]|uniref:hypothetical protein n=1 Tax=uncultured Desulfobulbus sp. TaxID=239745 RepID=UPI0029C98C99|nr:hypothetical protein [uncultured Desulfobulbus sp.]
MHDMEEQLSLEIKKEIADRYFGFRKLIEDDSRQYNQHIREAYRQLENEVGFDLIRLYILLRQESRIHDFFRLTGLRDQVFLDPYLLQSPTIRQRLFKGQAIHGLTRRSRFHNLFMDIYNRLCTGVAAYGATLKRLVEEGKTITEEIELFHRKNDLGSMMGFLRRLDSGSTQQEGPLTGGIAPLRDNYFEDKMRLNAPAAAEQLLPAFPALPPVKSCKNALQDLIDAAFEAQGRPEVNEYRS